MEKAAVNPQYNGKSEIAANVKKIDQKLKQVLNKEIDKTAEAGTYYLERAARYIRYGRKFVQKNPYSSILISTSAGLVMGITLSALTRTLRK